MTKIRFEDFMNQLDEPQDGLDNGILNNPLKKSGPDFSGNLFQDIQQGAGFALTKTLTGISAPGQGVMGFFNALSRDKYQYEQLWAVNEKSEVKFQWNKLDDLFTNAGRSAIAQAQRTWQSDNLTELGQNYQSGAELLKNLPGGLGEAWSVDDTRTKIGAGVMGFLLEVALDPAGLVAKTGKLATTTLDNGAQVTAAGGRLFGSTVVGSTGARNALAKRGVEEVGLYAAGGGIAKGIAKTLGAGERAQDVARRLGGNAALGNIWAGTAVIGARESVAAVIRHGQKAAQDFGNPNSEAANTLLNFLVGPTASATESAKRSFVKAVAMEEELPRLVNTAAQAQQSLVSRIPKKQRAQAGELFSTLAASPYESEAWETSLTKLEGLGVDRHRAESIANTYKLGITRMIDVLQEGGNGELVEKLGISPDHIRQAYRINLGGRIRADQLDYQIRLNTPASYQIADKGWLRARLETLMTGGKPNSAEFFDLAPVKNPFALERPTLPATLANKGRAVNGERIINDADSFGVKNPVGVEQLTSQKFVPLSLLENSNYPGVDLERAAKLGIKTSKRPDEFISGELLNPPPGVNNKSVLAGLATAKTDFPSNPLDVRVGEVADLTNVSGNLQVPSRLPNGYSRVKVNNKFAVEEAKAVLAQTRKNLINDYSPDTELLSGTGTQIVVDSRGYLLSANSDGIPVGVFVHTPDGGLNLIAPHSMGGLAEDMENPVLDIIKQGHVSEGAHILVNGEKATSQAFDNMPEFTGFADRPSVSKTNFTVPVLPGQNVFPRLSQPSTNPFSPSVGDKTVPRIQGGRNTNSDTFVRTQTEPQSKLNELFGSLDEVAPSKTSIKGEDFLGREQINQDNYRDWNKAALKRIGRLEVAEQEALFSYGGGSFRAVNEFLRGELDNPSAIIYQAGDDYIQHVKQVADGISNAMVKHRTRKPMTLYRGISEGSQIVDQLRRSFQEGTLKSGSVFEQPGFTSTSVDEKAARVFSHGKGVMFELDLPANTPSLPMGNFGIGDEYEVLVDRGQNLVIKNTEMRGDTLYVQATLQASDALNNAGRESQFAGLALAGTKATGINKTSPVALALSEPITKKSILGKKQVTEYRVPPNEAIRPGQAANTGPFAKNTVSSDVQSNARILSPEKMDSFFGALGEFMDGMRDAENNIVGRYQDLHNGGKIKKTIDGQEAEVKVGAQEYWKHLREKTEQRTVSDLMEFAHKWGESENIPDAIRKQMAKHVAESVTFVPGSREWAMGVKRIDEDPTALDELKEFFGDAFNELEGVRGQNFKDRGLPEAFHGLYGKVEDFSVRAMDQARAMSETVARKNLLSEMVATGVMTDNPFPGAVVVRQKITPEEAQLMGLEGHMDKDWWMTPGNLAAMKNSFQAVRIDGKILKHLQPFSNAFRKAALITDVSAHVTQMLGNFAMLSHMGYGPLFDDPRKMISGMKRTFASVTQMDSHYQEMVDSGLQVAMSPLSEGQRALQAERQLLREDSRAENVRDVLTNIHGTWYALMNAPGDALTRMGQNVEDRVTRGVEKVSNTFKRDSDAGLDYVEARQQVSQVKPGVMFGLHDMLARGYVWDQVVRKETTELVEANPWLASFVGKTGLIDSKQLSALTNPDTFAAAKKQQAAILNGVDLDDVKMMVSELQQAKQRAAEIGNEVALNYFETPRFVRTLTQSGVVPFMKFQWKAMGRFGEWMDERPWQFAPYYKAQFNGNEAFSDKPEDWMQTQQSLPMNVRNALVLPTGTQDAYGRQEFLDLSRWVPFGMLAGAAGGAVNVDGQPMPNQLISAPMIELALMMQTGHDAQGQPLVKDGQSKVAAIAQKMALFFSPSGVGPGGRRAAQLANAMEQSKFVLDENGQPMYTNPAMNAAKLWGELPAEVGAAIGNRLGDQGSALGASNLPEVPRPWTTPDQAVTRGIVPGMSFSADREKAYGQINNAFDSQITTKEREISEITNSATYQLNPQQFAATLQQKQLQISQLQVGKQKQLQRLVIGSE